jgi:hypothetical protein
MAVLTATPTTLGAVETRAQQGDTIILEAGAYTQRPNRPGVTYQAIDWAEGRVLRGRTGHLGEGMAVVFRTTFNLTDVGFTASADGDFHLLSDSGPLAGTGYPLALGVSIDADGYLRSATTPDAGPYEYGASTTPDDPEIGGGGSTGYRRRIGLSIGLGRIGI